MKIERLDLLNNLKKFVFSGSGVVIGSPGAGKTYSLNQLTDILEEEKKPYLFLRVDQLGDASEYELRSRLGYEGKFLDEIRAYMEQQNEKPGIFILDGFDAARDEYKRDRLLWYIKNILKEQKGLWNIIVSVRTYDAKKSQELLEMFGAFLPSDTSNYRDPNIDCRHFLIPLLDESEIRSVFSQVSSLEEVFNRCSAPFRNLLRVPFNLWLIEQLLSKGVDIAKLSSISSEVQLLGVFWEQRIIRTQEKDNREYLLRKLTMDMVKNKSLSSKKEDIYEPALLNTWNDIQSDELILYLGHRVVFSHNILFDYAVSRLIIEDNPQQLVHFVTEDPSRPLFLRPSITYYLTRLWYENFELFWQTFWYVLPNTNPYLKLFAKIIPPIVVINEVQNVSQLNSVVEAHLRDDANSSMAILRLIQALRAFGSTKDDVWVCFFREVVKNIKKEFVWDLSVVLSEILTRAIEVNNREVITIGGEISRNILSWILDNRSEENKDFLDRLGSAWLVPMVAKTFYTSPSASRVLLGKILSFVETPGFTINYIYRLSDNIEQIWPYDSQFASSIYETVFAYEEKSEEVTHMGGVVLSLTSTRRQDYEMCQYILIKKFPQFLKQVPFVAIETIIKVLNRYIITHEIIPYLKEGVKLEAVYKSFKFGNKICKYLPDISYVWDESEYHDRPLEMAKELFRYIEETAQKNRLSDLDKIIEIFKSQVQVAYFWRKFLKIGVKFPVIFSDRLFDLCIADPILIGGETTYELGEFLKVAFRNLSPDKRGKIERKIIDLPNQEFYAQRKKYLEEDRNRLLACLPTEDIVTEEAKRIKIRIESEGVPENKPLVSFKTFSKPFTTEDWLKEQGADLDKQENQEIKRFFEPLEQFVSKWTSKKPTVEAIKEIFPVAQRLHEALNNITNADAPVINTGWAKLGACICTFCRAIDELSPEIFKFSRTIVLICAKHPLPEPKEGEDESYKFPSWSSFPRTEAAQAIIWIASRKPDKEILDSIDKLVFDPVPSVRFLTVRYLPLLVKSTPEKFWDLITRIAQSEKNEVVQEALCYILGKVLYRYEEKSVEILKIITSNRKVLMEKSKRLEYLMSLLMVLVLVKKNEWAIGMLNEIIDKPLELSAALKYAAHQAVEEITPRNIISRDKQITELTNKAISWAEKFIISATNAIKKLREEVRDNWTDESRQKLRDLYEPIDNLVMRFYFSVDVNKNIRNKNKLPLSDEERENFYKRIKPLLERILEFSTDPEFGVLFASTAYHFMELLNGVLKYDPPGVLHLATGVVKASEPYNYNFDSLAIKEVVRLVESILTDHRSCVREKQSLEDLLELLDIFAKVGWTEALLLVWRLDEIFR